MEAVDGKKNRADMLTKSVSEAEIVRHMTACGQLFVGGRAIGAKQVLDG